MSFSAQRSTLGPVLFLIAALAGASAILAMKAVLGLNQILVTAVPCVIMLLYVLAGLTFRGTRLRMDQTADNCYYLGFIFTLISLAVSLYQVTDPEQDVRSIITNFGIAIFSTILGLVLRVFLAQMRQDPYEIEQQSRAELATAARRLRVQLDQSVAEFSLFGRELRQIMQEGMEETRQSIDSLLETGMSQFTRGVEAMSYTIEESNRNFDQRNQAMLDSAARLSGSIAALGERIDGIKVSENIIAERLAPAMSHVFTAAQDISKAGEDVARKIRGIAIPTDLLDTGLHSTIVNLNGASGALRGIAEVELGRTEGWNQGVDFLLEATASLRDNLEVMDRSMADLRQAVSAVATGSHEMDQLPKVVAEISDQLRAMTALLKSSVDNQVALTAKIESEALARQLIPQQGPLDRLLSRVRSPQDPKQGG